MSYPPQAPGNPQPQQPQGQADQQYYPPQDGGGYYGGPQKPGALALNTAYCITQILLSGLVVLMFGYAFIAPETFTQQPNPFTGQAPSAVEFRVSAAFYVVWGLVAMGMHVVGLFMRKQGAKWQWITGLVIQIIGTLICMCNVVGPVLGVITIIFWCQQATRDWFNPDYLQY